MSCDYCGTKRTPCDNIVEAAQCFEDRAQAEDIVRKIRARETTKVCEGIFTITMDMSFDGAVDLIMDLLDQIPR